MVRTLTKQLISSIGLKKQSTLEIFIIYSIVLLYYTHMYHTLLRLYMEFGIWPKNIVIFLRAAAAAATAAKHNKFFCS